jgi:hypothetical protein
MTRMFKKKMPSIFMKNDQDIDKNYQDVIKKCPGCSKRK